MVYLTYKAELEPNLPYYVSFVGPFIGLGSNGEPYPNSLQYPQQGVISIHQILLRPGDVTINRPTVVSGSYRLSKRRSSIAQREMGQTNTFSFPAGVFNGLSLRAILRRMLRYSEARSRSDG